MPLGSSSSLAFYAKALKFFAKYFSFKLNYPCASVLVLEECDKKTNFTVNHEGRGRGWPPHIRINSCFLSNFNVDPFFQSKKFVRIQIHDHFTICVR